MTPPPTPPSTPTSIPATQHMEYDELDSTLDRYAEAIRNVHLDGLNNMLEAYEQAIVRAYSDKNLNQQMRNRRIEYATRIRNEIIEWGRGILKYL